MDYTELLDLMKHRGYSQKKLAVEIGVTEEQLCKKLKSRYELKQGEILRICGLLGICKEDIGRYFFTEKGDEHEA